MREVGVDNGCHDVEAELQHCDTCGSCMSLFLSPFAANIENMGINSLFDKTGVLRVLLLMYQVLIYRYIKQIHSLYTLEQHIAALKAVNDGA